MLWSRQVSISGILVMKEKRSDGRSEGVRRTHKQEYVERCASCCTLDEQAKTSTYLYLGSDLLAENLLLGGELVELLLLFKWLFLFTFFAEFVVLLQYLWACEFVSHLESVPSFLLFLKCRSIFNPCNVSLSILTVNVNFFACIWSSMDTTWGLLDEFQFGSDCFSTGKFLGADFGERTNLGPRKVR